MDCFDRFALMACLERKRAEGLAEIARRQAEREQDPLKMDDYLRAQRSPLVRKSGDGELLYRDQWNDEPESPAEDVQAPFAPKELPFTPDQEDIICRALDGMSEKFERALKRLERKLTRGKDDEQVIDLPRGFLWRR